MRYLLVLMGCLLGACATQPPVYTPTASASLELTPAQAGAKLHTELAAMYYERSQMGVALGEIAEALKFEPSYAPAYGMRGLIYMALRDDQQAENDFNYSLRLDPNNSEVLNNYGWYLCQRNRDKESLPLFLRALRNPLYATPERAYLNAGLCSKQAGNAKDAEEFLNRALQLQADLMSAHYALAEVYLSQANFSAAKRHFETFTAKQEALNATQLWLGVRIARKLEDRTMETQYGSRLLRNFPDSVEAKHMNGKS